MMIDYKEVIEDLKTVTFEEVVKVLINNVSNSDKIKESSKGIFSVNELIENYPMFTRYSIDKAIKEKGLPFFMLGNKKFFEREALEKWIKDNNTSANKKKDYYL